MTRRATMLRRRPRRPRAPGTTPAVAPAPSAALHLLVGPIGPPPGLEHDGWLGWRGRGAVPATRTQRRRPVPVRVSAASVDWVARLVTASRPLGDTTDLEVHVRYWQAPTPGWIGKPEAVPFLRALSYDLPGPGGDLVVRLRTTEPVPLSLLLQQVVMVAAPHRRPHASGSPEVGAFGATGTSAAPAWSARIARGQEPDARLRTFDLVIGPATAVGPPAAADTAVRLGTVEGGRVVVADPERVAIDSQVLNPMLREYGRRELRPALVHRLAPAGRGWTLTAPDGTTRALGAEPGGLAGPDQRALRRVDTVTLDGWGSHPAVDEAALVVGLAACGVPVSTPSMPPAVADLVHPELRALVESPLPDLESELDVEVRSLRQVRAAVRNHDATFTTSRLYAQQVAGAAPAPSVSVLLMTRRPEFLAHCVEQVRRQTYPELELVLGLHGWDRPEAELRAVLGPLAARTTVLRIPADVSYGGGLAQMTRRASGTYLAKVDDDDWYAPDFVGDLVLARHFSGGTLVGHSLRFLHVTAHDRTYLRAARDANRFGRTIAGGTLFISRGDLESVGGWRMLPIGEDIALMDRVVRAGGLVYRSHGYGYLHVRRDPSAHTWQVSGDELAAGARHVWDGLLAHPELGTPDGPVASTSPSAVRTA